MEKIAIATKKVEDYLQQVFFEYKNFSIKNKSDRSLFVLCRLAKDINPIKALLKKIAKEEGLEDIPKHFEVTTIHKSKKREARCVIVYGDTKAEDLVPLKAFMYRNALGDGFCHRTAQQDEQKNIIYVGISRAKEHAILLIKGSDKGIAYQAFKDNIDKIKQDYYTNNDTEKTDVSADVVF